MPFFFSSRSRHTRWPRDWSSDVCSSDLGELVDDRVGTCVLPDDRVVNGLTGSFLPDDSGFALVGDADGGNFAGCQVRLGQRSRTDLSGITPDLLGVVLHPAGFRNDLLVLDLIGDNGSPRMVEDDAP